MKFTAQDIRTVAQAENFLQQFVPAVASYTSDDMSLVRMWPLLEALGNPQDSLRVIHVAGTSGKTSTCYYISAYLAASGQKVGLTVSPHIDSITERVQIDGHPLGDVEFCDYLRRFMELVVSVDVQPSYFELLTAFELWVFAQEHVDYVVLETGMGGLLDASNVVTHASKVCVITDIGDDHMHILGTTLPEIAAQKAGIIHNDNAVWMYEQSDEVMQQIAERRQAVKAGELYAINQESSDIAELPAFQQRNWQLARSVCEYVADRDNLSLSGDFDPLATRIPARMDTIALPNESTLIYDGAHNQQKTQTLVSSFQQLYPGQKADVLIAVKQGKEYKDVIDALRPIVNTLLVTTFATSQDLPATSQDPQDIAEYARSVGLELQVEPEYAIAYAVLLDSHADIKLVTGSFYLIGQIRALDQ